MDPYVLNYSMLIRVNIMSAKGKLRMGVRII